MFRPMHDRMRDRAGAGPLTFSFDGKSMSGRDGDTVAAALLANGVVACRETPVSDSPRAPYCLMGVCFECLVVIDGVGNRQGCLIPLVEGMRIETQHGRRHVTDCVAEDAA